MSESASYQTSRSFLQETMKDLFTKGLYSDMNVVCEGFTFNVHQAILCPQSSFFKAAMEGEFEEAKTRTINLPADDLETIERVLSFLYLEDYSVDSHTVDIKGGSSPEPTQVPTPLAESYISVEEAAAFSEPDNHIQVYLAADKFGIPALKTLSAERLKAWANKNWQSPAFLQAIQDIRAVAPAHDSQLKDILVDVVAGNINPLIANGAIISVLGDSESLATAVLAQLSQSGRILPLDGGSDVDRLVKKVNSVRKCRHCGYDMNTKVEKTEFLLYGTIRCALCNTRH
ncbi:BTB/POZ protein [Aspergillus egyptiacus]|nr:BTB/POZ protein [Aspergillus egyptiacus]